MIEKENCTAEVIWGQIPLHPSVGLKPKRGNVACVPPYPSAPVKGDIISICVIEGEMKRGELSHLGLVMKWQLAMSPGFLDCTVFFIGVEGRKGFRSGCFSMSILLLFLFFIFFQR